jgi:hypothetical protein
MDIPDKPLVSYTCGACGAPVGIRAAGLTVTVACSACGAISDLQDGNFKLIENYLGKLRVKPAIELGTKAKIRGHLYQLVGFMQRCEKEYLYDPWDEYLFVDAYGAYCWLVESKGHWTQFKVTKSKPQYVTGQLLSFLGDNYAVYHKGTATVQYVVGEFYWRVRVGDTVKTLDAIHPPRMISQEQDDNEIVWSIGEYLSPEEIEAAFHLNPPPAVYGVAPHQPAPTKNSDAIWRVWIIMVLILLGMQFFGTAVKAQKPFWGEVVTDTPAGLPETEIAKFAVTSASTHVTIHASSPVYQNWIGLTLRIVPEDPTNPATYTFEKDLSYYSGVDSDGSWSEGSQEAEFLVNGLPRGNYRVLLAATPAPAGDLKITTRLTLAPTVWSNFWLALFFLSLPPVWMLLRKRSFERKRWADSEYNPYQNGEGEND